MAKTETKTETKKWKCDFPGCGREFSTPNGLGGHKANAHGRNNAHLNGNDTGNNNGRGWRGGPQLPYSLVGDDYRCDVPDCGYTAKHASTVRAHIKNSHGITAGRKAKGTQPQDSGALGSSRVGTTRCPECEEVVDNRAFARHMEKHGRDNAVTDDLDPDIQAMIEPLETKLAVLTDSKANLSLQMGAIDGQINQLMKMLRVAAPARYLSPSQLPKGTEPVDRPASEWRINDTQKWMAEEHAKGREHFTVAEAVSNFGWKRGTTENVFVHLRESGVIRLVGQADGGGKLYAYIPPAEQEIQLEVSDVSATA